MATQQLGEARWLSLWKAIVVQPDIDMLHSRRSNFSLQSLSSQISSVGGDTKHMIRVALEILAAFSEAMVLHPKNHINSLQRVGRGVVGGVGGGNVKSGAQVTEEGNMCDGWLPNLNYWPIFFSEEGHLLRSDELLWPCDHFERAPADIRALLRKSLAAAGNDQVKISAQKLPKLYLLHSAIEETLSLTARNSNTSSKSSSSSQTSDDWDPHTLEEATNCVSIAKTLHPDRIVTIEAACNHFLRSIAEQFVFNLSSSHIEAIRKLFLYALTNSKPYMITYLLVENVQVPTKGVSTSGKTGVGLVASRLCYLGSSYDPEDGVVVENLCTTLSSSSMHIVSKLYLEYNESVSNRGTSQSSPKKYCEFLQRCGAQVGVSLLAKKRSLTDVELKSLSGGVLPTLRTSTPSCSIFLPYGNHSELNHL